MKPIAARMYCAGSHALAVLRNVAQEPCVMCALRFLALTNP